MKLWKRGKFISVEHRSACPKCEIRLQLTGEPPSNPSEYLIKEIAGESELGLPRLVGRTGESQPVPRRVVPRWLVSGYRSMGASYFR